MEKIADITGVLCVSVFIIGLFYQIGGFEKTARIVRFVVALCIISTLFTAFKDFKYYLFSYDKIHEENEYRYDYTAEFYNTVIFETQTELEKIIKNRLDEKNISYNEISVHILEQNGDIVADKIVIGCNNDHEEAVYNSIKDMLTDNTKVFIGE